ncbi:succinate dehydrogenase, hydrophobic membrane anchor protein [Pseudoalteromonas luteoviolacea]|uniref:succinate dehydrogenase, hydrophobic membrane anchor protein n=1 Tax=Pseudoalteromonas luteoviolacea TaxID=43657 RepID=UPI001B3A18BA|nr:succinate dehydrogenase, hydrophobic membrane anchor protein [Pseudoalteromonas luteoviolacea]MBQ4876215.1 succinate dehydrogenase, hydrophobic membrane anchor protein [Pseudoalteromonas luteoviolacea]MBQ4906249.1 succinate dehydrogenase, hydrophobic membrane anchor protein [Pseudoalteromonas luteoviolacea]
MAITGIARSGTKQWVLQRFSNALIVLYTLILIGLLVNQPVTDHQSLLAFIEPIWFKVATTLCVIIFALNGMLAGWQIAGDYVKSAGVYKLFNTLCVVLSFTIIVTGIKLLWL